jgi:signal transduction histidine kinase
MTRRRSTVRLRLTAFYGFLFFCCGAVLILVSYLVVRQSLIEKEDTGAQLSAQLYNLDPEGVRNFLDFRLPQQAEGPGGKADTVGDVIGGVQGEIRNDALDQLLVGSGIALGVMLALSILVGWLAAGRAMRPVKKLTATARDLSDTNLDQRIALDGPDDELKELADTLDAMLARLEVAFLSQRRFAADVSHELRTPLSIIRAEVDVALADPESSGREHRLASAVGDAADRAEGIIESLLALARSESTMHDRDAVDLAELTGDVVGERVESANQAGIAVDLDLGSATVDGDRWLLERLVANLVDNGINHNVRDGFVHVSVDGENGSTRLEVVNSGKVLTADDIAEIFQPFRRLEADRGGGPPSGFGLGMTIVRSVTEAHDGTIDIDARREGGLDVVVTLPSRARPTAG